MQNSAALHSSEAIENAKDEDTIRSANDAIIVAIGIVAVLVANVAYVGYLTPPGGPDPYWQDCTYGIFVVFTALNGFALVFAVAAIIAVTMGPAILIWQNPRGSWRTKVVRVGLLHLCLSLLAFMGAFACAGFVTALVRPPPANCGLIKCSEGGVPCSTDQQIPFQFHDVAVPEATAKITTRAWYLDPQLLQLNSARFHLPNQGAANRAPVICANYPTMSLCNHPEVTFQFNYVSSYNFFDPCGNNASLADQQPCICATPNIYEAVTVDDYSYTTWCSVVDVQGAPQKSMIGSRLLVTAHQAYNMVKVLTLQQEERWPGNTSIAMAIDEMQAVLRDLSIGPWGSGPCFSKQAWTRMPNVTRLLNGGVGQHKIQLLQDTGHGGLKYNYSNLYQDPQVRMYLEVLGGNSGDGLYINFPKLPSCEYYGDTAALDACRGGVAFSQANKVLFDRNDNNSQFWLAHAIRKSGQWWQGMSPFYEQDEVGVGDPYGGYGLLEMDPGFNKGTPNRAAWASCFEESGGPLSNATSYATFRYMCSNGVLCDKGDVMHPLSEPLAVDPQGQHLTRKDVIKFSGQDLAFSDTTRWLQWSVAAMLLVAFFANLLSVLWLTGYLEWMLVPVWSALCRCFAGIGPVWNNSCARWRRSGSLKTSGRASPV